MLTTVAQMETDRTSLSPAKKDRCCTFPMCALACLAACLVATVTAFTTATITFRLSGTAEVPSNGRAILEQSGKDVMGTYTSLRGEQFAFETKHNPAGWLVALTVIGKESGAVANLTLLQTGPHVQLDYDSSILAQLSYELGTSSNMSAEHSHGVALLHMLALSTVQQQAKGNGDHGRALVWQCWVTPHADGCGSWQQQHSCQTGGEPLSTCSDGCQGMCGPSCDCCWTWVCGDCCCNNLCMWHDNQYQYGTWNGIKQTATALYLLAKYGCNAAPSSYGTDAECTASGLTAVTPSSFTPQVQTCSDVGCSLFSGGGCSWDPPAGKDYDYYCCCVYDQQ